MSLNSNTQNTNHPQLLQQRLNVREQEINGLKVQNRHLLGRIEELEKAAKPNQIDTQFVADEVRRHLDPIIQQLTSTLTTSFEMLQGTMRGIYQQSQRSQKAVEDMSTHTRDLEIRLNDQRRQDQNFYQDKVISMVGNFCDRVERQIDIRLKALSSIEVMNSKQNEVLGDLETLKAAMESIQKNSESNRADIARMERTSNELTQKIVDLQLQSSSAEEISKDTLRHIQNHRGEFKLVRSDLKQVVESVNSVLHPNPLVSPEVNAEESARNAHSNFHLNSNSNESSPHAQEDATMVLSLLRAQRDELEKVAEQAKAYVQDNVLGRNAKASEPTATDPHANQDNES